MRSLTTKLFIAFSLAVFSLSFSFAQESELKKDEEKVKEKIDALEGEAKKKVSMSAK